MNHTITNVFDAAGNKTSVTDANNHTTTTVYNLNNKPTETDAANGLVTKTSYDPAGNIASQTDGATKVTSYTYDSQNHVASVTDPKLRKAQYTYDANGNRATAVNALNKTTTYSYDADNRLSNVAYGSATTPDVAYIYNAVGQRASMTDQNGETDYRYDGYGELLAVTGGPAGSTRSYTYDADGDILTITYPSGLTVTNTYNDADQKITTSDWRNRQFTFSYDPDGDLAGQTSPNGVTQTRVYDNADETTAVQHKRGTATLASFAYTNGNNGQIASITPTGTAGSTQSFGYDNAGQLTSATAGTYGHDSANNLTSLADGSTLTYDAANEPVTSVKSGTTTNYTYNANGDRLTAAVGSTTNQTLTYDQADRLTKNVSAAVTTNYTYDGDGLRSTRKVGSAATKTFVWDANTDDVPYLLTDGDNQYLWGPEGELLEQTPVVTDTPTYPLADVANTVGALTNTAGTVTATYGYSATGKRTATTGTGVSPFGFDGQYMDAETGFIYLRARLYDPATGQFLTRDPLVSLTRSPYGYADGDYVNGEDPTGLWGFSDLVPDFVKHTVSSAVHAVKHVASATKDFVVKHKTVILLGVGAVSLLAGGAGVVLLLGEAASASTIASLAITSVVTGVTSAGFDAQDCVRGVRAACAGAAFGAIGAALGNPFAASLGIEANAVGLLFGSAGLAVDGGVAAAGEPKEESQCESH